MHSGRPGARRLAAGRLAGWRAPWVLPSASPGAGRGQRQASPAPANAGPVAAASPCQAVSTPGRIPRRQPCSLVPYLPHRRTLRAPRSRGPVHGVVGRPVGVLAYRSEGVRVGQRACGWAGGHAGRSCGWVTRAGVRACGWAGRLTDRWACGRRMIAAGRRVQYNIRGY